MCVRALQPVCPELCKRILCSSPHFWWQKKSKCGIDVCAGAPIGTLTSDTELSSTANLCFRNTGGGGVDFNEEKEGEVGLDSSLLLNTGIVRKSLGEQEMRQNGNTGAPLDIIEFYRICL